MSSTASAKKGSGPFCGNVTLGLCHHLKTKVSASHTKLTQQGISAQLHFVEVADKSGYVAKHSQILGRLPKGQAAGVAPSSMETMSETGYRICR